MDSFEVSVIDYLGKLENGILVLISLMYQNKYYEATFFYTDKDILLTIPDNLEEVIGDIKNHSEYPNLLRDVLKKVVPYLEMINRIDEVDFTRWVKGVVEMESGEKAEMIKESEITREE